MNTHFHTALHNVFAFGDTRQPTPYKVASLALFSLTYFVAAEIGHALSFAGDTASFWPPAGLALTVFWLVPYRCWPMLFVATALANLSTDMAMHGKSLIVGTGFWIANSIETVTAVLLLKWWTTKNGRATTQQDCVKTHTFTQFDSSQEIFASWQNIVAMFTLACTLATGVGALLGASVISVAFDGPFWESFRVWWAADAVGMLVVGSLGQSITWIWKSKETRKSNRYSVILLFVSLAGLSIYIFGFQSVPITYTVLPLLFFLALLGEFLYCAFGLAILAIIAIAFTTRGLGPFADDHPIYIQATLLQSYLIICAVSTLMFTALVRQRNLDARRSDHHQRLHAFVFEHSSVEIAWIAGNGSIVDANPQFCKSLGYSHAELLRLSIQDIAPHYASVSWDESWAKMKQAGASQFESVHRRKDGKINDIEVFASFGEFEGTELLLSCVTNITQRKRSTELITALFESSSDAHLIFDHTGIVECNRAAVEMLRMESKQQLFLKHPAEFSPKFQPDGRTSLEKSIEMDALGRTKGFHRFDWVHTRADGEDFPCEVTLTPIRLESGDALLVVWHEISERMHFEEQLLAANRQLTAINEELTQFAYIASHDLKAPLRAINSLADFVIEDCVDKLPAASMRYLHTIKQRIFRMQRLLEDLLEYSQAGQDQSATQKASSQTVIQHAIELCDIPPTIAIELSGNEIEVDTWITPLETCLRNLIGNSVKHRDTPSGRIRIHCEQAFDFIIFSVSDDGRGIPAEHHERIFRMFEVLKRRDEVEGSGMGLAFVKKTVETYGGRITVESPNAWFGTTFYLRWPNAFKAIT